VRLADFGLSTVDGKEEESADEEDEAKLQEAEQNEDGDSALEASVVSGEAVNKKLFSLPLAWAAPERLARPEEATQATDVWAFGVAVWEIFSLGGKPYAEREWTTDDPGALERFLSAGGRLASPAAAPTSMATLMRSCWSHRPAARPIFSSLARQLRIYRRGGHPLASDDYVAMSSRGSSAMATLPRKGEQQAVSYWQGYKLIGATAKTSF